MDDAAFLTDAVYSERTSPFSFAGPRRLVPRASPSTREFIRKADGRRSYHTGDTALFDGFAEIGRRAGPIDLACLPIGAYEPRVMMGPIHLNSEEAVRAALDLGTRLVVGMHFGTFDLSDEPLDEPPRRFLAEAQSRGLGDRAFVMAVGETRGF
jgi:N-acyl-phosphatidylethanolamine-hydrolysing phospholipase D